MGIRIQFELFKYFEETGNGHHLKGLDCTQGRREVLLLPGRTPVSSEESIFE